MEPVKKRDVKRRLKRVIPSFVSLVDAPANETEFALYKRKEGRDGQKATAGAEPQPGSAVSAGAARKEATTTMSKKKDGGDPKAAATTKAMPEGTWGAQNAIKSAMSWLGTIAGVGGDPWDMTGLDATTVEKVKVIVGDLAEIVGYPVAVERTEKSAVAADEELATIMAKVREELGAINAITAPVAPVEKKGAKISQARLAKIQAAMNALDEVLKDAGIEMDIADAKKFLFDNGDVDVTVEGGDDSGDGDGDGEPAAPPEEDEPATTPKPDEEGAAGSDGGAADDSADEIKKSLSDIVVTLGEIQKAQTAHGESLTDQSERLEILETLRGIQKGADGGSDAGSDDGGGSEGSSFGNAVGIK